MRMKLKDVETNPHEEESGTCEICMGVTWVEEPTFIFELENGDIVTIEAYYWDWGDYTEVMIDNVIDFASYVSQQEFLEDVADYMNFSWIEDLVEEYEYSLRNNK